jgi:hypothetical protein
MLIIPKKFSDHAVDRMVQAYKGAPRVAGIISLISKLAAENKVELGSDGELYVVAPGEGVFVIKGDTVVTFIHKSRIGEFGECQRAWARFNKKVA